MTTDFIQIGIHCLFWAHVEEFKLNGEIRSDISWTDALIFLSCRANHPMVSRARKIVIPTLF